jgi:branched-chain amino acid transport system permease protein
LPRRRLEVAKIGLIFGVAGVYLCLVGLVETFKGRWIVQDVLGLGLMLLLITGVAAGFVAARRLRAAGAAGMAAAGAGAGALVGVSLAVLLIVGTSITLRTMFVNASPVLFSLLAFGRNPAPGSLLLLAVEAGCGLFGALLFLIPVQTRRTVLWGLTSVLVLSMFQDLLQLLLQSPGLPSLVAQLLFTPAGGPSLSGAAGVGVATVAVHALWTRRGDAVRGRIAVLSPAGRRGLRLGGIALALVGLLIVPQVGGLFVAQVMVLVGLYTLMGLGLNLEIGFAGLLDLGFVAFFAIGAYSVALLTSRGELGTLHWSFWAAVPVAVAVTLVAGVLFGVPVLRVRGDYLAIATLGLGEIVRILVLSDALSPWLGGSFGVLTIPRPVLFGWTLGGPRELYYLTLAASALVAFIAWRLQDSRLGRAWMAIREDEDVAQAIGINLVSTKLLSYGLGGAMGGIGGAIFAVMVGSVFPHSFQLLISINVLVLIILGGMGSLWGVVVGALALVGLPELLREFGEYRFLVYGAVLVAMMLYRPEGLLPAAAQKRELHAEETQGPETISVAAGLTPQGGNVAGAPGS